ASGPHPHLLSFPTRRSSDLSHSPSGYNGKRQVRYVYSTESSSFPRTSSSNISPESGSFASTSIIRPVVPVGEASSSVAPEFKIRSEEHTSELQSRFDLVCRL